MFGIFDVISEIGTAIPYLYRIWGLLLSSSYRKKVLIEYNQCSKMSVVFDISMSLLFFTAELVLIYMVVWGLGE